MSVTESIREAMAGLTSKQKSIAQYIMDNPDEASYLSLKELSTRAVRKYRYCGFAGRWGTITSLRSRMRSSSILRAHSARQHSARRACTRITA